MAMTAKAFFAHFKKLNAHMAADKGASEELQKSFSSLAAAPLPPPPPDEDPDQKQRRHDDGAMYPTLPLSLHLPSYLFQKFLANDAIHARERDVLSKGGSGADVRYRSEAISAPKAKARSLEMEKLNDDPGSRRRA